MYVVICTYVSTLLASVPYGKSEPQPTEMEANFRPRARAEDFGPGRFRGLVRKSWHPAGFEVAPPPVWRANETSIYVSGYLQISICK